MSGLFSSMLFSVIDLYFLLLIAVLLSHYAKYYDIARCFISFLAVQARVSC